MYIYIIGWLLISPNKLPFCTLKYLLFFRGGSRRAKRISILKPRQPQNMEPKGSSNEAECSTTLQDVAATDDIDSKGPKEKIEEKNETLENEEEGGWGKIIYTVLKLLLLGIASYCYDLISKLIRLSHFINYL